MFGLKAPNQAELDQYAVNTGGAEVIWQPLYDYQSYATAGALEFNFFQQPNGQGGKTLADTNMKGAGQLPAPQAFLATGIEVAFFPGVSPGRAQGNPAAAAGAPNFWNDVWSVLKAGYLTLTIGDKPYLIDAPLMKFPPRFRLGGSAALADSTTAGGAQLTSIDYASGAGVAYQITPLKIPHSQNFSIKANFAALVATPSGQNGRIGVILNGWLRRSVQ